MELGDADVRKTRAKVVRMDLASLVREISLLCCSLGGNRERSLWTGDI